MSSPAFRVTSAALPDWPEIERIYRQGISTGQATFQRARDIPDGERWFAEHLPGLVFKAVAESEMMLGWAALAPVSRRRVYAGVAEVSVYVAKRARGQSVGLTLMRHLILASEAAGVWTLQAGIFPENVASIALHKRVGFRVVGVREKLGKMGAVWRDVILMERRSTTIW